MNTEKIIAHELYDVFEINYTSVHPVQLEKPIVVHIKFAKCYKDFDLFVLFASGIERRLKEMHICAKDIEWGISKIVNESERGKQMSLGNLHPYSWSLINTVKNNKSFYDNGYHITALVESKKRILSSLAKETLETSCLSMEIQKLSNERYDEKTFLRSCYGDYGRWRLTSKPQMVFLLSDQSLVSFSGTDIWTEYSVAEVQLRTRCWRPILEVKTQEGKPRLSGASCLLLPFDKMLYIFRVKIARQHLKNNKLFKTQLERWRHSLWIPGGVMSRRAYKDCTLMYPYE